MPELPEVETTRRGLAPHLIGRRVVDLIIRQPQLRWPVAAGLQQLRGQRIESVERRAKYLLVGVAPGSALLHLGMSGSLRVLPRTTTIGKHDHVDWLLDSDQVLRYTDPRRFGSQLWQADGETHPLLINLGPEPLSDGNIYAAEALFAAGIRPTRAAGLVSRPRYARLADEVKRILVHAITRGGTTLRDFLSPDGAPGYFEQELFVYGRAGQPCRVCAAPIRAIRLGQRSTFFCPRCQR